MISFRQQLLFHGTRGLLAACCLAAIAGVAPSLWAQAPAAAFQSEGLFAAPQFPSASETKDPIAFAAQFRAAAEGRSGRLQITAKLEPMWHVYSVTQAAGGPLKTAIDLSGEGAQLAGPFTPDKDPLRSVSEQWPGVTVEEHEGTVVWTAPLRFAAGTEPETLELKVELEGLTCQPSGSCVPFSEEIPVTFKGTYQADKPTPRFRDEGSAVEWKLRLVPPQVAPGEVAQLEITATPDQGYHVYVAATDDRNFATNFVLTRKGPLEASPPEPSDKPITGEAIAGMEQRYHEGKVTWTIPLRVPKQTPPGGYPIEGLVGYQACTDSSCLMPRALQFSGVLQVGTAAASEAVPLDVEAAPRATALDAAATVDWLAAATPAAAVEPVTFGADAETEYPLALVIVMALGAGLILNLMPCVLPVLGLKVMAFVNQAGQDRKEVLATNLWYSLGVMSIFWLLAAAVALLSFSWGQQFTFFGFRFAMAILVFAFALSFLGVWELPVPGFASGDVSQELQHREGALGSFSKGVFTTLLATPCSGPLLGVVLGLMLGEPPVVIFAVFTAMGLGMALPFLAIAVNPRLVAWMPKPGNWMETLKQFLAFILLGTVAFFFATFNDADKLAVFISLIGVWFGCWLIGRVPHWESWPKRLTAWSSGIGAAAVISFLAFNPTPFREHSEHLAWEPYSEARLEALQAEGKTVLIDFTAKWCLNCHANYVIAINTAATAEMVEELDAVVMLADWTDRDEAIKQKLNELQSNAIPVLAIYPGSPPRRPIVLRDLISQQQVLDALAMAGPSLDAEDATSIAMRDAPRGQAAAH